MKLLSKATTVTLRLRDSLRPQGDKTHQGKLRKNIDKEDVKD